MAPSSDLSNISDCTTAPRNGLVSGCYPLGEYYKRQPEWVELAAAKRREREQLSGARVHPNDTVHLPPVEPWC